MNPSRLFWLCLWAGNGLLLFTGLIWWHFGWKWALVFLIGGPLVMIGAGVVSLLLFFLFDGGVAKAAPCQSGCGRLAPVQLRGQRYRRPYCDVCEREQRQPVRAATEEFRL